MMQHFVVISGEYVSSISSSQADKSEAVDVKGIGGGPLLIDNESFNFKFFPKVKRSSNQESDN